MTQKETKRTKQGSEPQNTTDRLSVPSLSLFPFAAILSWPVLSAVLISVAAAAPAGTTGGGTLRLARLFDPVTLDPPKMELQEDVMLVPLLYQTLLDVHGGTNLV